MRMALGAAALVTSMLVPAAAAQAPARAGAVAKVASGDLGTVGRAAARDHGRDAVSEAVAQPGLEIAGGRATARAARAGGEASARAAATADGVSLFGGLVTAERVSRTARARDGGVTYGGSVAGLVVNGERQGDRRGRHRWRSGGARVTINDAGEGLRVRLTRAVAGFARGTTVVVAAVSAEAVDGADPVAEREPGATPSPEPAGTPEPGATPERAGTPEPGATPERAGTPEPGATPERAGTHEPGATPAPANAKPTAAQRLARGRFVFPVYGDVRVADDFGAARQIGPHRGNDLFAAFGSPVLAVADGTLNRVGTLPISGNRLWLKTERGDSFFYAHLSAFGPEAVSGRKVKAGTLLGFVGNTGDAEPTPPHVHFEIHPGAAKAIDPHAVLIAWQARGEVPSDGWLARYGSDTEARPGALVEVRDYIAGE